MTAFTVSVVVEWENILLAEAERCRRMLRQLVREAETAVGDGLAAGPIELLVCFDADEVDDSAVTAQLAAELPENSPVLSHRLVPVPGAEYYALKNAGAREVQGELLVFLDSDVVPEPGWLGNLLRPFGDETLGVVAGNSYLEPNGLYGKTFALAWFFPLRATEAHLRPAVNFFANNVAFRRRVFEQFPFPRSTGPRVARVGVSPTSSPRTGCGSWRQPAPRLPTHRRTESVNS